MTTETITDIDVEKVESEKEQTRCDRCGKIVADGTPSPTVVINPSVSGISGDADATTDEIIRKMSGHSGVRHNRRGRLYYRSAAKNLASVVQSMAVEGHVLYEDACSTCIHELSDSSFSGEELMLEPGVTITEQHAIDLRKQHHDVVMAAMQTDDNVNMLFTVMAAAAVALTVAPAVALFLGFAGLSVAIPFMVAGVVQFVLTSAAEKRYDDATEPIESIESGVK